MISIETAVWVVIYLIAGGIIYGLLTQLVKKAPFIPEEWRATLLWVLLALAILVLIGIILDFSGHPIFVRR